jgi:hypothetical protein
LIAETEGCEFSEWILVMYGTGDIKVGCARAEAVNLLAVEAKVQSQDFWWVE